MPDGAQIERLKVELQRAIDTNNSDYEALCEKDAEIDRMGRELERFRADNRDLRVKNADLARIVGELQNASLVARGEGPEISARASEIAIQRSRHLSVPEGNNETKASATQPPDREPPPEPSRAEAEQQLVEQQLKMATVRILALGKRIDETTASQREVERSAGAQVEEAERKVVKLIEKIANEQRSTRDITRRAREQAQLFDSKLELMQKRCTTLTNENSEHQSKLSSMKHAFARLQLKMWEMREKVAHLKAQRSEAHAQKLEIAKRHDAALREILDEQAGVRERLRQCEEAAAALAELEHLSQQLVQEKAIGRFIESEVELRRQVLSG